MKTYKNLSQVAKKYNVSSSTITMWVKAAKEGKNNLLVIEEGSKVKIIDNQHNDAEMSKLKDIGEKYRPSTHVKRVKVNPKFFEIFNDEQISEIITSLENYSEIPHKFTYLKSGAKIWAKYVDRSIDESLVNTVTNTIKLLKSSYPYLIDRLKKDQKVNIVDIGTGDGRTIKEFIAELINQNKINEYIGVDISEDMFDLLGENLEKWFSGKLSTKTYLADINKSSLEDKLFYLTNNTSNEAGTNKNYLLFLETTLENQRAFDKTLINLKESLGKNDELIIMQTLLSKQAKTYFDFWTSQNSDQNAKIPSQGTWIPELLGLSSDYYEPEYVYKDATNSRFITLKPIHTIEIDFSNEKFKKVITIEKGQSVILWRHSHHKLRDIVSKLNSIGLEVDYLVTSDDKAQVLLSCSVVE